MAVGRRRLRRGAVKRVVDRGVDEVVDELGGGTGVPGVARRDGGVGEVLGHPPGDAEPAVVGLLQVLAHHRGQQLGRVCQLGSDLAAIEHRQPGEGVAGPGVDELATGVGVVPAI